MAACASGPPPVPYPAFIQSDELPDVFLAALPGTRAKQFSGDPRSRRSSNRIALPADWQFSTGGSPDKSVEIFVLEGAIKLGEFDLAAGGYAYLPSGSPGMSMTTEFGAVLLYFLDNANATAVIQTPLITNSDILDWRAISDDIEGFGFSEKALRADPGSGAVTRLLKIEKGAVQPWHKLSVPEEGYLLSGHYQHSECVNGETATYSYVRGGYFMRPSGAVNGGPESHSLDTAIWFLRTLETRQDQDVTACAAVTAGAE
jgi:quercetin dioxygenase-like cupin family protein